MIATLIASLQSTVKRVIWLIPCIPVRDNLCSVILLMLVIISLLLTLLIVQTNCSCSFLQKFVIGLRIIRRSFLTLSRMRKTVTRLLSLASLKSRLKSRMISRMISRRNNSALYYSCLYSAE